MTLRITLAPTFVDNTYGSNTIGWPSDNHTFNHLKGSDHLQIALYDANDAKQLEFKMDYIDTDGSAPSGYSCLGLDGNGDMISGNENYVVDITSSLDKNLNEFGYVLLTNSPSTDNDYTPNGSYPNWIYEVWYEVVIDLNAFGNPGFGYPEMTSVHASPSKTGNNSEDVEPVPCIDCEEVTISVNAQVIDATECEGTPIITGDYDECCQSHGDHYHISGWNLRYVGPTSPANIQFYTSDNSYGTTTYSGTHSFGDFIFIEANDRFDTNSEFTINGSTVDVHTSCSESTNVGFGIDSNGDFVPNADPNDPNVLFIIHGLATAADGWCGTQSNQNEGCNGTADVTVSGGATPYTYSWSDGSTASDRNDLCAGTYTVTVTDANGCTGTTSVTVDCNECDNVTNPGSIAANQTHCGPFDVAELTSVAAPSGGSGDLEIVWITRPGTSGSWNMVAGANGLTYDPSVVSVTTQYRRCARRAGCTDYVGESNIITITIYPGVEAICSSENGNCANGNQASASVSASGGTAPYTYLWSTGATTVSISNLTAGSYSVTITDANGCEDNCSVNVSITECCNVTDPGEIAANGSDCSPFDPPMITSIEDPSGGLGALEIVWITRPGTSGAWSVLPGATGLTYNPGVITTTTQYRRCARRAGCTSFVGESNIITMTVTGPCCDNVTNGGIIAENQSDCGPFDPAMLTSVSLPSGGSGALEYVWLQSTNGGSSYTVIAGANGPTYDPGTVSVDTWFRRCARRAGCTPYAGESNWLKMTVHPNNIVATCTAVDGDCNNNNEASASVSASGGTAPFTYLWSTGATTVSISNLTAGSYSVTVTDVNGCSDDCSVTVTTTPCCNVTNGGQIAGGGSNCGPFDPAAITSASLPTGGLGDLEYVWLWNTQNVVNNGNSGWQVIAGANGSTYDPGQLTETRCFLRCARRSGCTTYVGESNIVCFTVNPGPTATCSSENGTCSNNNEGSASVSMTGGTAPYTYAWSNGATTQSIDGLDAGTYSVTVTDANGCSDDCSVTVTTTPCCNVTDGGDIAAAQENCGPFDPAAFTSVAPASGGLGDLEYVWLWNANDVPVNNGNNGWVVIPNSNSETYDAGYLTESRCFIRCARRSGCTTYIGESNVICVTINPEPVATCSSVNGGCNNNNEASASVSVNGGTAPFSYAWSNGATTASIDGLASGTYSVTVTDANGCSDDCSVTVSVTPCCNVTDPGSIAADQENCGPFDPVAFTSVAPATGGLGPVEYLWLSGTCGTSVGTWTALPNSNSATYDAGMVSTTTCFIRCSRNVGCTQWVGESNIITITVNPDNVIATCSATDADCNGASTGSATVSASGGTAPYTVLWSTGATTMVVNNLMAGSYSVTVTDANGCSNTCSSEVEEPASLTATCSSIDGTCNNNNEASASVSAAGGTAPYTYEWSNGATTSTVDGLAAGTYSVTVTDANGCSDDCSVNVTVTPCCNVTSPGAIAASQDNCGGFDPERFTSVSLPSGGLGDLEYVWLVRTIGGSWSTIPGATSFDYDAPYTDVSKQYRRCARRAGCTSYIGESNILTITVNPEPVATCSSVNGDCNNNNEASASVSAAGGTAPYSYAWSNGATTSSIDGLAAGTYSVTVTDANGCSDDCSVTVTTTPCCDVTDPGTVAGSQDGCGPFDPDAFTSVAPASGGLGGIVYQWYQKETETSWMPIPGATSETYDPGMISINSQFKRCARREGCPEFTFCSNVLTIEINPVPNANCSSVSGNCSNGNGASATVSVQGGTPQYSYDWSNGATTASIDNLADGTYSVTVTDELGCADDCSVTVTTNSCCNVTNPGAIAANQENCGAFDPVAFTSVAPASGGIGTVEYVWLSGACGTPVNTWAQIANSNSETIDVGTVTETTCFIRCARNSGCSPWVGESNIITITVNDEPVATCSSINGDCSNNNEASASVSVTGGSGVYSYAWSNGATTTSIEGLAAGTYSVTVTDLNGCSNDCSVTVTTNPCCDVTDPGSIAASQSGCGAFDPDAFTSVAPANGGLGGVVYQWFQKETETAWMPISGATSETYDAGMISINSQFKRCARREGCPEFTF